MRRLTLLVLAGAALFAVSTQPQGRAQGDDRRAIREALVKIARAVEKGDNVTAKKLAAALARKVEDLSDIEKIYSTRRVGGLGTGIRGSDGIELYLSRLAEEGLRPDELDRHRKALVHTAHLTAATAEVTRAWVAGRKPKTAQQQFRQKQQLQWADEVIAGAGQLAKAAAKRDEAAVRAAALRTFTHCQKCHR
jgi:hypothetical protein